MIHNIHKPKEFLKLFCKASGIKLFDPADRACVITRSPADYGQDGTILIEWEGSPPRFPICFGSGMLIVDGKRIRWQRAENIIPLLRQFLEAHPANDNGSPVWIGLRLKERRQHKLEG